MNFLAHQTVRNILYQVLAIGIVAGIIGYLVLNLQDNLAQRNIEVWFLRPNRLVRYQREPDR